MHATYAGQSDVDAKSVRRRPPACRQQLHVDRKIHTPASTNQTVSAYLFLKQTSCCWPSLVLLATPQRYLVVSLYR